MDNLNDIPYEGYSVIEFVMDNFKDLVLFCRTATFPVELFGVTITWWHLILSLLLTGTIINFIVGDDSDI